MTAPYEIRVAVTGGAPIPEGYTLVNRLDKIPEYRGELVGQYPALSLVACALNGNGEAARKMGDPERDLQFYIHPTRKAA